MNLRSTFRRHIFPALAALLFVAAAPNSASAAEPVNLISNGNFETDSQGWPKDWGRAKDKTMSWEQESGNHFLRLHSEQPGQTVMAFRDVALPPDAKALESF